MSTLEDRKAASNQGRVAPPDPARNRKPSGDTSRLLKRSGLIYVAIEGLNIRRLRCGRGFRYVTAARTSVGRVETKRLAPLAVPPAYEDVFYAPDPSAHLQAVGRDAAGRLQYRYHPDWQRVRETRKARRLARLAEVLPLIRRGIGCHLRLNNPTRAFVLSAIIELVARSGIRPGSEQYARLRGTLGAATLLKSNVTVYGETVHLQFRAKGGKQIEKDVHAPKLAAAIGVLQCLPGRRLFQYRDDAGAVSAVNAQDVNRFLRDIAGVDISLKDFRTLLASVSMLEALACAEPATNRRARRAQVLDAIRAAAADLGNTPAICGKSYGHDECVRGRNAREIRRNVAERALIQL